MTLPRPLRIVTVPGRSLAEVRAQARVAADSGADLVEVRVDRLDPESRRALGSLFPSPIPLLATYRSRREAGEGSDDGDERGAVLAELAQLPFEAIDWEVVRDRPPPAARRTIAGLHAARIEPAELHRRLAEPPSGVWFAKAVVAANLTEMFERVLPALPAPGECAFVAHTTGESGPLLRAWADRLGMAAVYCSLPSDPSAPPPVEPSQLPVDRVRQLQEGSGPAKRFAILGSPVGHSRSPAIHSRWIAAARRRGIYIALEARTEEEFTLAVQGLAEGRFAGVNVTHPWKGAALAVATESSRGASRCGCANTLVFDNGSVRAENTDLVAVLRRLDELRGAQAWEGDRLMVLGSGGAARATLAAAEALGAQATVLGRDRDATDRLARDFGAEAASWGSPRRSSLVVNATPVGRSGSGRFPGAIEPWVAADGVVLDFVYAPEESTVSQGASSARARYEDGWRLLVYQAAESYQIWWESPPPSAAVAELLREGPCAV